MERTEGIPGEIEVERGNLSRLVQASLRISESIDFDSVLQGVLDNACSLTESRYGVITLVGTEGNVEDFVLSGFTQEEHRRMLELPEGSRLFEYFGTIDEPLRLADLQSHLRNLGLPEFRAPMPLSRKLRFMAAPIFNEGERLGCIYIGERREEFTEEDEQTLVMFATQTARLIANSRRFRDEQRARADLEALIETSPVGVVVLDVKTGVPVSFNRETRRIISGLGITTGTLEELLGMLSIRRADGTEFKLREFPLDQVLQTGETVRAEEITIALPDGRSVDVLLNATPIRSGTGEVETFVVTLQDLAPLEELERLRAEFLGVVSHELRAPLSSIKGSATTLLGESDKMDPVEMRQFFRLIDQQADRMRDLIGNLMDVARIETGTMPVAPEPEDVARLVERARESFARIGTRRNLRIQMGPDLPKVMADRRRIAQVLDNLLANAERFSPESSTITIRAELDGVHVALSVSDQGRGVSSEDLPHLFRRFTRLGGEEAGWGIAGAGLGLSICKGIVEAHGGRIWAESDGPGLGTTIKLTIPASEEVPLDSIPDSPEWNGEGERRPECILAVEDDPEDLRYIRDTLTKAGFRTLVTAESEEAFRLVETYKPDLVLLDWLLPDIDGIELLPSILAIADVPVIFLSVYGRDDVIARAFEKGATDYVVKPFSPTELVARVRAALRRAAAPSHASPREPYTLGELSVNYPDRQVSLAGQAVQLTPTEYQLLFHLTVNAGVVLTHEELLQRVWGLANSGDVRLVRGVVKRLRAKLRDDVENPKYIFTETGVGYRMAKEEGPKT